MKNLLITQARYGSSRLPGKVLKEINGVTLLEMHLNRLKKCKNVNEIIVATTVSDGDEKIYNWSIENGLKSYRGSEDDVLDRFYQAAKNYNPEFVVRVTSDCPLLDPKIVDAVIESANSQNLDYCSNTLDPHFPDGQDVEVIKFSALEKAWKESTLKSDREHVTPYVWRNSDFKGGDIFKSTNFDQAQNDGDLRMTVDEPEDFELIKALVNLFGVDEDWTIYRDAMRNNAEIQAINKGFDRNEGLEKSLAND